MSIRLGDTAPDFTADTTQGLLSFHDWKAGSWAVLFSHPADFTPVCTTELGRTAALSSEFAARNTKPIAISVDSVENHLRWTPDIARAAGVDVDFPIIADEDRAVANAYDMLHPNAGDTSTVRSVFIIDPNDKVRLTITYPKSVGGNFTDGVFVGQHGSWNRNPPVGYKVVFVPFRDGKPAGDAIDFATGFRGDDGKTRGRPVGVSVDPRGAVIVADDLANTIWRITPTAASTAPAATPSATPSTPPATPSAPAP
jgi:alkyl hydroperoxide reductase subunit AhpC